MMPPWPPPVPRPRRWPAVALILGMVAITALCTATLIVALTRPAGPKPPTFTAAEEAAAKTQFCERYRLAAEAVHIETNLPDVALARISTTNGALMLESAAADPALDSKYREAGLAQARTYLDLTAMGTGRPPGDPELEAIVSRADAGDAALEELCRD